MVMLGERRTLAICPRCGSKAYAPIKTWPIPSRTMKESEHVKLVGWFECPQCKARFRSSVETEAKPKDATTVKSIVEKIMTIKGELMQTLKSLREKINTLETERASLIVEIERLRKAAESRVEALQSEVSMLRNEAESLREVLGYEEEREEESPLE